MEKYMYHAGQLAREAIRNGADEDGLVHLLRYPEEYYLANDEVMGLSSPITWDEWKKGGWTEPYWRLGKLAAYGAKHMVLVGGTKVKVIE